MHSFTRLRTPVFVAGLAMSLVLSLLAGASSMPIGSVQAQAGSGAGVLPVIFTADPDGVMRGYNVDGDFIDEETFANIFGPDPTDLEDLIIDYVTRVNSQSIFGASVIAGDVDTGYVYVSDGAVIDSSAIGYIIFDADFDEGDRLFSANLDRSNDRAPTLTPTKVVPDRAVNEILIVRGDTGLIDVYQYQIISGFPIVHTATLDLGIDSPEHVAIGDVAATESADDNFRFGRDALAEIFVFDPSTGAARVFDHEGAEFETLSFIFEYGATDHVVMGNVNGVGGEDILIAHPDTGQVDIYDIQMNDFSKLLRSRTNTINVGFGPEDQIDLTDVNGNGKQEILVAQADSGDVDVFRYDLVTQSIFSEPSLSIGYSAGDVFTAMPIRYPDQDGDGLFDHWETDGVDVDGDGFIDIDLPDMGADPRHKDLFVEYDYAAGAEPSRDAVQLVKDAFAAAPVDAGGVINPDREPGINLWIDTGSLTEGGQLVGDNLGGGEEVSGTTVPTGGICGIGSDFDAIKDVHFDAIRTHVFRYALSIDSSVGCGDGGRGEFGGNDFVEHINVNDLGSDATDEAGMFMHELGHNLGLLHGGFEHQNCKPNYISVMNYSHNFGIPSAGGGRIIDYSPARVAGEQRAAAPLLNLIEESLDETRVLDPTDTRNMVVYSDPDGYSLRRPANGEINWNANFDAVGSDIIDEEPVEANIDNLTAHSRCENDVVGNSANPIQGHDDWRTIVLNVQNKDSSDAGAVIEPPIEEPTVDELIELKEELHTNDLALDLTADTGEVVAGTTIDFTLTVENLGPNPADDPEIEIDLPNGMSFQSSDADCSSGSEPLRCSLDQLLTGESATVTVTTLIDPDLVYESGGPVSVTTTASIDNTVDFASDPDTSNNSVEIETDVVAEADLEAVDLAPPAGPVEVILNEVTQVEVDKAVANHGPSGPMDVALDVESSPSEALDVTFTGPASLSALELDEKRQTIELLDVLCIEPGLHTVQLTSSISPLNPEDTDPDTSNNQAEADLTVECVTPVAIDIKPDSDENPVNMRGNVPVAVLTTGTGEYGLPVAFDATAIDPQSVLFGPRDTLFGNATPNGAGEIHDHGHPEDVDADDDLDMMLHFRASQSGLGTDTGEACVRGEYVTADGGTATFFGCDEIGTVP